MIDNIRSDAANFWDHLYFTSNTGQASLVDMRSWECLMLVVHPLACFGVDLVSLIGTQYEDSRCKEQSRPTSVRISLGGLKRMAADFQS